MGAIELMKADSPKDYSKLGCMKSERWEELSSQLKEVEMVPSQTLMIKFIQLIVLGNCE